MSSPSSCNVVFGNLDNRRRRRRRRLCRRRDVVDVVDVVTFSPQVTRSTSPRQREICFGQVTRSTSTTSRHVTKVTWAILKTYVSLALHSKRYETRLTKTVEVCNVLLICEVHSFEKHPHGNVTRPTSRHVTMPTSQGQRHKADVTSATSRRQRHKANVTVV